MADRDTRGTLIVSGADRTSFLHGLLTNDIQTLPPGGGCYAAWLTPQGRLITDMRVLVLADRLLLGVRASDAAALAGRLDKLVFSEDVQIVDAGGAVAQVRVAGPRAAEALAASLGAGAGRTSGPSERELASLPEYSCLELARDGEALKVVAKDDGLGVQAFDVLAPPDEIARLRRALEARGVPTLDDTESETLRIEAGRPLFGVDMDTDTIPLEAGIEDRAISFSKGCYVGQEVIVRVTTRGQGKVARKLVGLVLKGSHVPARHDAVGAGDREIGRVTSATWSPGLGKAIALAYVHRDFAEPSTSVTVGQSGDRAVVTPTPFGPRRT
jgi:folate-binding protein YgfZ